MLCHYGECHYAEGHILFIIMLSVVMPHAVMLGVVALEKQLGPVQEISYNCKLVKFILVPVFFNYLY